MIEAITAVAAIMFWLGLVAYYALNKLHEKHMRMILDAMEKERKLYQIVSNQVQSDFQRALDNGWLRVNRGDNNG